MNLQQFKELIIFESDDYYAINKPAFISSLDQRIDGTVTLSILKLAKMYNPESQLCHRLDKETSGVLLIAKNPEAYRHAAIMFEDREVGKVYHAISAGIHDFQAVNVNLPILPTRTGYVVIDTQKGKNAETFFQTIQVFKQHTLIQCIPVTGRMHQIRIHLSVLKAPIVNDSYYGGSPIFLSQFKRKFKMKQGDEEQKLINRIALHAHTLRLPLPNGDLLEITAPYNKDMRALINQLEKNS